MISNNLCNLLLSRYKHGVMWVRIESCMTKPEKKPLRIIIDNGMEFDEYISKQCKKAGKKCSAVDVQ